LRAKREKRRAKNLETDSTLTAAENDEMANVVEKEEIADRKKAEVAALDVLSEIERVISILYFVISTIGNPLF